MKFTLLKTLSYIALAGTIIPSLLVFFGEMDLSINKQIMTGSMILWFATAPFWVNGKKTQKA